MRGSIVGLKSLFEIDAQVIFAPAWPSGHPSVNKTANVDSGPLNLSLSFILCQATVSGPVKEVVIQRAFYIAPCS